MTRLPIRRTMYWMMTGNATACVSVSEELMQTFPGWRREVRQLLRDGLAELGEVERVGPFMIDPYERYDMREAPPRSAGIRTIAARGQVGDPP
jgi:hypothetical protein